MATNTGRKTQQEAQVVPSVRAKRSKYARAKSAVDRIVAETNCSRSTGWLTLVWIRSMVRSARRHDYAGRRITMVTMWLLPYDVFDRVIPHGSIAAPGSAHEAIEDVLLNRRRDELGIRHEADGYCTFRLSTSQYR